jgi:hypothetical protein
VSTLTVLLERLRRMRPPPGTPANVLAVPSAGEDVAGEVAFLFEALDGVRARARAEHESAQAAAAVVEADAQAQRAQILAAAREQGERVAARLLCEHREACEREAATLLADARREAARVLARGRESTPTLVAEVMRRIGGQSS